MPVSLRHDAARCDVAGRGWRGARRGHRAARGGGEAWQGRAVHARTLAGLAVRDRGAPVTDAAPLLVLVAGPRGPLRDAVIAILDSSEMFELARCVDAADAVVTACRERRIDVLVLDEDIAGGDARRLAQRLALERPIPTLLLVRDV